MLRPLISKALFLVALALAGCATPRTPWIEDGVERGSIRTRPNEGGELHQYLDMSGRVVRVEQRTLEGEAVTGEPIEHYEFDSVGRSSSKSFTDWFGNPVAGPMGFAARRTRHESSEDGMELTHHEHFDADDRPMLLPAGFFRETVANLGRRLEYRRFFDIEGQRVSARIGDWDGVNEITYAHLQGATPIVMEMYVDNRGEPLFKRKISGHTERRVDHHFAEVGYHNSAGNSYYATYPVYVGTSVTYSSAGK